KMKFGMFFPNAKSDLWEVEFDNMTFKKEDFVDPVVGFEYEYVMNPYLSFILEVTAYSKNKTGDYRDWVGDYIEGYGDFAYPRGVIKGYPISHIFGVSITPIQFSFKFSPVGIRAPIKPYFGAGIGIYFWRCKLEGMTPLFDEEHEWYDPYYDVYIYEIWDSYIRDENNVNFGWHAMAGLMFPIGYKISLFGEFKYNQAKGELDDFIGFEPFDLSGYQISLGFSYKF
ncbi:outer membrane beta-barrel protein, partial [Candidatus Aminicenantes bacterium AH-873-B07]|nr:outer membrane beta-barrel protein [Candidatus Aminicenantes bacterium AH-873-B07]